MKRKAAAAPSLEDFHRLLLQLAQRALTQLEAEADELPPKDLLAALTAAAKLGEMLQKHAARAGDANAGSAARKYAEAFRSPPNRSEAWAPPEADDFDEDDPPTHDVRLQVEP